MAIVSCPYCAEEIQSLAKKCKHCGEILDHQLRDIELLKSQKQNVYMNAGDKEVKLYEAICKERDSW